MKGMRWGKGTKRKSEKEKDYEEEKTTAVTSVVFWVRSTCYFGGGMSVSGVGWSARVVSLPMGVGCGVSAVTKIILKNHINICMLLSVTVHPTYTWYSSSSSHQCALPKSLTLKWTSLEQKRVCCQLMSQTWQPFPPTPSIRQTPITTTNSESRLDVNDCGIWVGMLLFDSINSVPFSPDTPRSAKNSHHPLWI